MARIVLPLLLWASSIAHAQQKVPAVFRDFSGALNDNTPSISLQKNESPRLLNVVVDEPVGAVQTRKGISLCGNLPSGNTPTALFEYFQSGGSRKLIVTDNQNYYETRDCQTWTTIVTGLSATANPSFAIVRDLLWVANKSTHVWTWDGSVRSILDGRASTPNPTPPSCAFLQFWKERVWCARSDSSPSAVAFSALTDSTGGLITPSTGSAAWPATNVINIDQNGGSPIYGMRAYRDNLYVFKNNGIWKILFENEFNITVQKTFSSVGSRFNTAIVENDGLIYFVGPDGIYAFDGDVSKRISDNILNLFESLRQPLVNEQFNSWTTAANFAAGTLVAVETNTVVDSLGVGASSASWTLDDFQDGNLTASPAWTIGDGNWAVSTVAVFNTRMACRSSADFDRASESNGLKFKAGNSAGIWSVVVYKHIAEVGSGNTFLWKFIHLTDGSGYNIKTALTGDGSVYTLSLNSVNTSGSETELGSASVGLVTPASATYRVDRSTAGDFRIYHDDTLKISANDKTYWGEEPESIISVIRGDGCVSPAAAIDDIKVPLMKSSGVFTSDTFNAVTVSSWSTFNVTQDLNGGTIDYSVKVGSNAGAIAARPFLPITPGGIIGGTTDQTLIVWKATYTVEASRKVPPYIQDVTVNYTQGGVAGQTIHMNSWKNRPWISASSGTASANNLVIVKNKNNIAWVPYDLRIGPMVRFNDLFYGGASTHSAIYRLDYGTNDNGQNISALWESGDETFGFPQVSKSLQNIYVDFEKGSGASTAVGWSRDNGVTFTEKTVNMSGSGRSNKTLFINGGNSTQFRFRARNNTLDESMKIYGIEAYGIPYKSLER